jgi:hypothetical protein
MEMREAVPLEPPIRTVVCRRGGGDGGEEASWGDMCGGCLGWSLVVGM